MLSGIRGGGYRHDFEATRSPRPVLLRHFVSDATVSTNALRVSSLTSPVSLEIMALLRFMIILIWTW